MWSHVYNVVANMLDREIVVSKFGLQSCNYFHFLTNTFGNGMNSLILTPVAG